MSLLFWNVNKNESALSHAACLAQDRCVDVFLFAESPDDLDAIIHSLNALNQGTYREVSNVGSGQYPDVRPKVRALTRLGPNDFWHGFTGREGNTAIWPIRTPKVVEKEVLLAATHLPAKAGGIGKSSQSHSAGKVVSQLADYENIRKHRNTVFVGDFNMSPFDPGMSEVEGIHGLMTASLTVRPDRKYRMRNYRRFYNPMWGLFGDRTAGPPGTYFWKSSNPDNLHWYILDQVLVRAALISHLVSVEIVAGDGLHSFLSSKGTPDSERMSDHLPIAFKLDV